MSSCELLGWCASSLILMANMCRREGLLRCLAIAANLAFIGYALVAGVTSVMVLHSILLLVNTARIATLMRRTLRAQPPSPPWLETLPHAARPSRFLPWGDAPTQPTMKDVR